MDQHRIYTITHSTYEKALQILGLNDKKGENVRDIRSIEHSYRRLARIHHPDRHGGDSKKFILLKAAKDFLISGGADYDVNNDLHDDSCGHCHESSNNDNGHRTLLSRVILRGRSCVRDLAIRHFDLRNNRMAIIAATDEGLKIMLNGKNEEDDGDFHQFQVEFDADPILCCKLSLDGKFIFAGNTKGQIKRYNMPSSPSDDSAMIPMKTLTAYTVKETKILGIKSTDTSICSVVSIDVIDDSFSKEINQHIIIAACNSPLLISMFRFKSTSVETLWKIADTDRLLDRINTIDSLIFANTSEEVKVKHINTLNFWLGGSDDTNEATLLNWEVDFETQIQISEASVNDDEEDDHCWWLDQSDSDSDSSTCDTETLKTRIIFKKLGFGSVFCINECPQLKLLAVTVGNDAIVLKQQTKKNSAQMGSYNLQIENNFTTKNVLYCVKILTKGRRIATCGAGESITIWSLERGTVEHNIHLNSLKHCNLSTNCIMSLEWMDEEGTRILSGGYDGNVTQWYLDNESKQKKIDPEKKIVHTTLNTDH